VVEAAAVALLNMNYPGQKLVLQLLDTRGRHELHRLTRRLQFQCEWVARPAPALPCPAAC
jgi:hypothetical protein